METIAYSYYQIDRLAQAYDGEKTPQKPQHGSVRARKWKDQQGPNPLTLMGLDRS